MVETISFDLKHKPSECVAGRDVYNDMELLLLMVDSQARKENLSLFYMHDEKEHKVNFIMQGDSEKLNDFVKRLKEKRMYFETFGAKLIYTKQK